MVNPSVRQNRKKFWIGALIVASVVLLFPFHLLNQPLAVQKTRVLALKGAYPFYWWLSDHELLLFRDPSQKDWTFVHQDVPAKTQLPLEELTRLFQTSGGKPESIQVAPDGKHLLWTDSLGDTSLATLSGKDYTHVKSSTHRVKRWMQDSQRWVELVEDNGMFVNALIYKVSLSPHEEFKPIFPPVSSSPAEVNLLRITPTADEHIIVHHWDGSPGRVDIGRIAALAFNASPGSNGKFDVPAPHDCEKGDLVFSPPSGHIAWVLDYKVPVSLSGLLGTARTYTGFWVTNMGSKDSQEIGSLGTQLGKNGSGPFNVQWTPDGLKLSFVYEDALWTLPIPVGNQEANSR